MKTTYLALLFSVLASLAAAQTARAWLHVLRGATQAAARDGCDWLCVLDTLRPQTSLIWQSLSLVERRRFLRHARPYWEVHRHRMPPQIAGEVAELRRSTYLRVDAGRLAGIEPIDGGLRASIAWRDGAAASPKR